LDIVGGIEGRDMGMGKKRGRGREGGGMKYKLEEQLGSSDAHLSNFGHCLYRLM
jgi:hypothetical protein